MNTSHHYHYVPESMTKLVRIVVLLLFSLLVLQLVSLVTPQPVRVVREPAVAGESKPIELRKNGPAVPGRRIRSTVAIAADKV